MGGTGVGVGAGVGVCVGTGVASEAWVEAETVDSVIGEEERSAEAAVEFSGVVLPAGVW